MAIALPLPPPLALVPPPARRVGGRPPLAIPNRPVKCDEGHRGAIRIHGNPDWGSRPFRRPRFLCVPDDPAIKPHTFSEPRRAACGGHPLGTACSTCDVVPGLAQGPLTPVGFDTSANEMGKVLALIGSGDSGRKAAQKVRYDAQRYETDEHGFRYASRAFGLSGRYIDLFGELIHQKLGPKRWPKFLVLDSLPLHLFPYDAVDHGERWDPNKRAGAVLAAVGGDDPRRPSERGACTCRPTRRGSPGRTSSTGCRVTSSGWSRTARRRSSRRRCSAGRMPRSSPASST